MTIAIRTFLLLSILSGCNASKSVTTTISPDATANALKSAPTVRQYIAAVGPSWSYQRDEAIEGGEIVAVGEEKDDHFTRGLTAKVLKDGRVFILITQRNGDEFWKLDN